MDSPVYTTVLSHDARIAYTQRNKTLRALGFDSYQEYRNSPLWTAIRKRVFATSKVCIGCRGLATEIHHGSYSKRTLTGKDVSKLFPVCHPCHDYAEINEHNEKVAPYQATKRLRERCPKPQVLPIQKMQITPAFVDAVVQMRIYLGMDSSDEARSLIEKLDALWPHGNLLWQ